MATFFWLFPVKGGVWYPSIPLSFSEQKDILLMGYGGGGTPIKIEVIH